MQHYYYCEYLSVDEANLFTIIALPNKNGKFPTVIYRNPYFDQHEKMSEKEVYEDLKQVFDTWVSNGYAVVLQHCRGTGKSSGECIPYINERKDGLALHDYIRKQSFYNGELYLVGGSYCCSVHLLTAPFKEDIKGAIFEVQDSNRYNCNYRNGFYKIGLHGNWYVSMYKKKSMPNKNFNEHSYNLVPLSLFSLLVFNEEIPSFDLILHHPNKDDEFWNSKIAGGETKNAVKHANIPILFTTAWYDIYTGGVFDMWNNLDDLTKNQSALLVNPYNHACDPTLEPVIFEKGNMYEMFPDFEVKWLNHIRKINDFPFELGKVTYYKSFENKWCTDDFIESGKLLSFILGDKEVTYTYDPQNPATFKGGLSTNFGGCEWQDKPHQREDIITVYTPEFEKDTIIKGKIKVSLNVKSNCEDTCFYVRLSLCKSEGDYGLRDDINQISNFNENYIPNSEIQMDFSFDEHAFKVAKGEKIRIDISSSALPHYVRHTNNKGLFSTQRTIKIADNTVVLNKSSITLPIE